MSNSPLVVHTRISPNRTSPRNAKIDTITIHCVVGQCTAETIGNIFAPASRQASSNYGVDKDGRVGMYVEEKDRSWCTSSGANDHRAITIEVSSDTTHPYAVTAKAFAGLLDLVTDICKRNGIKQLLWRADKSLIGQPDKQNLTVHRWFANKACPGDYLYNLHSQITDEVNKRLGAAPSPPVTPQAFKVGDVVSFTGSVHYTSSQAATGASCKPGLAKITAVADGAKRPYHLIAEKGGGSTVYGWVDAATVTATAPAAPPRAEYQAIIQGRCKFSDPAAVWAAIETHKFADDLYRRWAESYY